MKKEIPRDEFLRKRAERQRKIRKRRLIASFIVLIILALCTLAVLSVTVFFPIVKINITGDSIYTADALEKASGVKIGDNLIIASKREIESNLKKKLPYVDSAKLKRKLPDTLEINVTDAEEFACYMVNDRYYIVSESGWVLAEAGALPEELLTIIGADVKCKAGTAAEFKDSSQNELVDRLIAICEEEKVQLSALDISDKVSIKIRVEDRILVEIGTSNNIEEKIRHLRGMLKEIPTDQVGKIDLSFWNSNDPQSTFKPGVLE